MRVLLIRLGAFGDIIHTLPLLHDLHAAGHTVDWLCESRWAQVLDGNPLVNRIHGLPRRPSRAERIAAGRQLRRIGYGVTIDAQGLAKSAIWHSLVKAPIRLGFRPPRAREGAQLLANRRLAAKGEHVIDQQRSLGRGLRITAHSAPQFPLPAWNDQQSWADAWLDEQQLDKPIALNVGAGWPSKVWPKDYQLGWLKLAAEAGKRPLVMWGSPDEEAVAKELCAAVPSAVMAPYTTLPQLAALQRRCAVLVSGDTGPLHLAAAVACPTVGLFGPVPFTRNGPRGKRHPNLQAKAPTWERKRTELVDWTALSSKRVWDLCQDVARA
jgi:heptosyltransferase-1